MKRKSKAKGIMVFLSFIALIIVGLLLNQEKITPLIDELRKPKPLDTMVLSNPNYTSPGSGGEERIKSIQERIAKKEEVVSSVAGGGSSRAETAFIEGCSSQNGGVLVDVNGSSIIYECYEIAQDAGKSCRTDSDCDSYNCNLHAGILSGDCVLVKTDKSFENQTYIYTYECSKTSPGICGEIPRDMPFYYWSGENVLEYGERIFPNEQNEFKPV